MKMKTKNQKSISLIEWLCNKAGIKYEAVIIAFFAYGTFL